MGASRDIGRWGRVDDAVRPARNETGSFDHETDVSIPTPFGNIDLGTYGAAFAASTSGEIGMSGEVNGASGGTVSVDYPFKFSITGPADDTFAPGDTVTLRSTAAVNTGAVISSVYPQFSSVALNGTFGFHASASGEFCVGGCVQGSIFTVDAGDPVYSGQILSLSRDDLTLIQGLGLGRSSAPPKQCSEPPPTPTREITARTRSPDRTTATWRSPTASGPTVNDAVDASASASGSQEFMVLPISAVKWLQHPAADADQHRSPSAAGSDGNNCRRG